MIRRITFLSPALFALLNFTNNASAQMFTPGNIVVEQVGDGTSALASGVAAPLFLVEYSATGTLTNSVALPVAGPNVITTSGTATSEGNISLSANGRYIIVPGYNALPGTTGLTSTTSATVARVTGQVDASGTYSMPSVTNTYFSGNNIRGAASDGNNNYWATGANTGACYFGTGTPAIVYSTNTNNRAMAVYNGNLMFSAGAGTRGIYQFTGMPTTASAASLILPLTGSPYQFAINSTSTILYVADDASFTSTSSQAGGIEKFTWNGSAWVFQYTLQCGNASTAGARGLVVDFSGTNPVVYASTAESSSNRIISITDAGASSGSSATLLATAATNTIFRGLAFSPCSPPSITTVSSNSPVCSGSTLNLSSAVTGSAPLTYSWTGPNSFSGNTANPSISSVTTAAAGTYMLNLSNACGSASQNTTVVVNTPPSITTITNTSPVCSGSDINFNSAASGSAPLTFSWTGPNSFSSNSATPSITGATPLANGIYTLTVTNGCGSDMQTTVAFASLPVASTTSQTDVTCNGANDGTASVTVSGGVPSYSYTWTPTGGNAANASGLAPGTYTCNFSDLIGCTGSQSFTITEPAALLAPVTSVTNVSCNGGNDGSLTITASGGTSPYTYSWSSGGTGATEPGLAAGTYTCTTTDSHSCTIVSTATITQPPAIMVSATQTNVTCNGGSNGSINLAVSGGNPFGAASQGLIISEFLANPPGSDSPLEFVELVATKNIDFSVTPYTVIWCNNGTATANGWINGGAITYAFEISSGTATAGEVVYVGGTSMSTYGPSSNILRAISTGTASGDGGIGNANSGGVLGNGGSNADGIAVFASPVAGITSSTVPVDAIFYGSGIGGALVSAGTAGYQLPVNDLYPGGKLQSTSFFGPDPASGQYIFATGNYDVQTGSFTTPRTWNTSASFTNLASSVLLQGLYNFSWSNSSTTQNISGLSAGTYTYTISDNSPCPATGTITITEPPVLAVSVATQTDVSCNGANDGMVTVNATGGTPAYAYFWSPSGGTAAASDPLAPGSYTCTVTDSHACTSNASVTITEPAALTVSASSQTDVGCNGGNNGDASVTASGGTAPYMYSWSSGGTSATESGLAAGTYSCVITDAHACTVTQTFSITEPSALAVTNTTQNDAGCFGGNDGDASVTVSGGSAPYTYAWSSGGTAATESGLAAGTYSCVITDSHSCTVTQTFVIAEPVALSCTATLVNVSCNGGSNGSANVTPAGGTGPYTYAWSSGGTSATESGLSAGTYSCVITDSHSCTLTQTVGITEPAALSATATQNNVSCNGGNNGTATVSVSGGTASYSYAWSSGGTAATESGLAMGTYTCTITDANTCTATATVNITEPSALSVTTTQTDVTCNGGNNGTATVSVSGGTASYSYAWSSGGTAATESGLAMGTYTCNITDANSCTTSATVNITEPAAIVFSLGPDTMVCSPVTVNFCAPGGFASYLWNDNSTAQCLNAGTSGCYSVLATDANGCQSSDTICLTVNTCTGIDEAAIQGFDLFPNPNNGRFTIVLGSNQTQATLDIFDAAGQLIGSRIIHQDEEIDLSGYAKGFYFARINGETRKLIIQ